MPAEDFEKWYKERFLTCPISVNDEKFALKMAWLTAERQLLNQTGRSLPEQIALSVLAGNHDELGILADWLEDQGRLDVVVQQRLTSLLSLLKEVCDFFDRFGHIHPLSDRVRDVFRRPHAEPPGYEPPRPHGYVSTVSPNPRLGDPVYDSTGHQVGILASVDPEQGTVTTELRLDIQFRDEE